MAAVVSHAMRRFPTTQPDAVYSYGLRPEGSRKTWSSSEEGESALSRSMRYADPWLYGSVRAPGGLVLAPAFVLCACPDYVNGTKRSSKKNPSTCKKCKGTRLPLSAADNKFGTVRCYPTSTTTTPMRAGTMRVASSSSRASILPSADPYDLMRRSRLSVSESTSQFRARSISPSKTKSNESRSHSAIRTKKVSPESFSSLGRRSILECDINPYELMSSEPELKDSSITLVNGQRIRVRPPSADSDYEDVQVRKPSTPTKVPQVKNKNHSSQKLNEKESESNRFKSILKKRTTTFSDTDSNSREHSPSPARKSGSHFYLPMPGNTPRKKVQFLVENELECHEQRNECDDESNSITEDCPETTYSEDGESETSNEEVQQENSKQKVCKLRRTVSERFKHETKKVVFHDTMALRSRTPRSELKITFGEKDLQRLDGLTSKTRRKSPTKLRPNEPPPPPPPSVTLDNSDVEIIQRSQSTDKLVFRGKNADVKMKVIETNEKLEMTDTNPQVIEKPIGKKIVPTFETKDNISKDLPDGKRQSIKEIFFEKEDNANDEEPKKTQKKSELPKEENIKDEVQVRNKEQGIIDIPPSAPPRKRSSNKQPHVHIVQTSPTVQAMHVELPTSPSNDHINKTIVQINGSQTVHKLQIKNRQIPVPGRTIMGLEETPDCTDRCRSAQHGDIITAAISRRSVSDFDLCSYLNYICTCCESVKDSVGRTALHVAASCGRVNLVRWLVQNRHANINAKDDESGFTALHRSIFYGKINVAVELMKLGANTTLLDSNSLTLLDHAMMDGFVPESTNSGELYVWGSNCNNSLGPQQSRSTPELLDIFHKMYPEELVCKVVVEKFHSMIVTSLGKVFSCGHGQGGRLGLGTQQTVIIPEMVNFPETNHGEPITCTDVAISRDHSVFLCSDGNLYSCGVNTHRVLGLSPPPAQVLVPTQLKHLSQEVKYVCAGQYHSVAWGPECLYTWGLNAGQLGHKMRTDDKYISTPKAVRILNFSETQIVAVDSSDGAISVCTKKGDIYVLHEYQCRKIASRQLNVIQVSIFGGKLNTSLGKDLTGEPNRELKVVALTNTGNLLLWQESDSQLCRCIYPLSRPIIVRQLSINNNGLLFVTKDGEAFQGFIRPRKKRTANIEKSDKSAFHKFLEREDCISVKLSKFPRIHRAIAITSDVKGHDFCVIQAPPYKRFHAPEIIDSEMKQNMGALLEECHENDDLHDVVFQVDHRYFPAHRYVVASKSSHFEKLLNDEEKVVVLDGYNSLIFEQFLSYVYTGDCDLLKCGECSDKFKSLCERLKETGEEVESEQVDGKLSAFEVYNNKTKTNQKQDNKQNKIRNPVRMLHEMAKKLGCADLCAILSNYDMQKFVIKKKTKKEVAMRPLQFDKMALSELCDVTVKCADGKEVRAHKCILAAQSDYFNKLFSTRWRGTETTTITLPCSRSIVEALLEYLYTDTLSYLNNKEQDHLFKLIILADQLFITRLKEQCEYLLFRCLTLKNCVQFLSYASIYNAEKLKFCCLKFIVSNIAPLLELRMFDELDEALLKELSDFYFEEKSEICCRVITPYSTAPLEEEIVSVSSAYPVSLLEVEKVVQKSGQKRRSRTHKSSLDVSQKSLKEDVCDDNVIQFPDSPSDVSCDVHHVVPNRLRAIKLAEEKIECEDYNGEFTKLVSKNSGEGDVLGTSFEEFPLLNSPPTSSCHPKSHKFETKHKIIKMSQKQRKRLSSESNVEAPISESPKNPWKIANDVGSPPSPGTSLSDIMSSEKKQKENLVKIKSKLLIYTQIEDKAIEDLIKFYNAENVTDEFITVERVNMGAVAAPVWVQGNKKLES